MRYFFAILVLLSAGAVQAAPRIIFVGPVGDSPEAVAVRKKLPSIVTSGCGYALAETECSDLRCAGDAIMHAKAEMALEAVLTPEPDSPTPSLSLALTAGPGLDLAGKATTTFKLIGDGVARVCQQAAGRASVRVLEEVHGTPVDSAEVAKALGDNAFEVFQCAERAWSAAQKQPARGQPVVLDWIVRADGTAAGGAVTGPEQATYSTATECFSRVIGHWRFTPRPTGYVMRGYRLELDPATPPQPKAAIALPAKLSKEDIAKGVQAGIEKLGPCVTAARARKEIKAERYAFVLDWRVLPSGATTDTKLVGPPEVLRTTLRSCFEKAMLSWTFRPTAEATPISNFPLPITAK